ncbi:hypothetical protein M5689_007753 [Euphorbia peplus]|nr:hypothetical protein M5689_007753 [Euphorbia peplus]
MALFLLQAYGFECEKCEDARNSLDWHYMRLTRRLFKKVFDKKIYKVVGLLWASLIFKSFIFVFAIL